MIPPIESHPFFAAAAKIAILIFRQTGESVHANEEAERLYGYSQQELQQRKITDLVRSFEFETEKALSNGSPCHGSHCFLILGHPSVFA